MATSKNDLAIEYVELGGAREDFPEDLKDITAADIMAAIEDQKNKNEARAMKEKLDEEVDKANDEGETGTEKTTETPTAAPEKGVTFTLSKAHTYSTGRLPGKVYLAGQPFTTANTEEIKVLRASGRFKEDK